MTVQNPKAMIKTHPVTHSIDPPVLLLKKRDHTVIGSLKYKHLKMKLSGAVPDEISFDLYDKTDGQVCTFWDDVADLKLVDVVGYGLFEITIQKTADSSIVKTITGRSLETELSQIPVYGLHINDDEYLTLGALDEKNLDAYGKIKPIKVYNPADPDHSLLHLLIADKACHWQIGTVPEYLTVTNNGIPEKELFTSFQRTFTIDGKDIYSFLTEDLAEEANLVYVFDTYNRRIHIYDQYEIGEDTNVFINNRNLAEKITLDHHADSLKNCLKVVGGDDVITNYLSAVNMTGNYIWGFSDIQLKDMPKGLADGIRSYLSYKESLSGNYQDTFQRLCSAYDRKSYLESSMMPSVSLKNTTAAEQVAAIERGLHATSVAVSNLSIYSPASFTGITNNVLSYLNVLTDNRYTIECVDDITQNYPRYTGNTWTGKLHVYKTTDKTDTATEIVSVSINDDALDFTKQKIFKALAKNDMYDVDMDVLAYTTSADYEKLVTYFQKYSLHRLKSFYDGYEACLAILTGPYSSSDTSSTFETLYSTYKLRRDAVYAVYQIREKEVAQQHTLIKQITSEMESLQASADFKSYLDNIDTSYWKLFHSYRREDVYQNDNYVSDGLTDGEILAKCKELLDYAQYQLSMSCQLQRTCSIDLSNLLIMDEFQPFWDKFAIYNYIRVETDREVLKLRLLEVDIDFDSIDKLNVTFAENISGNGNVTNDIPSIIKQAGSIASSYNSTKLQSSQGNKAFNQVGNWIAEGLKAAQTTIANSDNNQVTLNNYGILLKSMTEEGNYGDFQTKIIGEGIYFTQDNWNKVSCALGTIYIDGKLASGLIADNIIGKLMACETLYLTNEKGSMLITGDTAKFTDITIDYTDKDGNRVKIGGASDRIFSISSNGNEVLYFNNISNKMVMTGTLVGCDGNFSGTLTACNMSASTVHGSTITGNSITGNTVSGNTISGNVITGNQITGGTITIGDGFYVNEHGKVTAIDGSFSGTITAGTSIISPTIIGGSIDIGNGAFTVDANGYLTANNGRFRGNIIGGTISIGGFYVDDHGNVTLPPKATLTWGQITGTEGVANKSDIPSDAYITAITKNMVQTEYIVASNLHVKSANINGLITASQINTTGLIAENISANTIYGKTLSGCTGDFTGKIIAKSGEIGSFKIDDKGHLVNEGEMAITNNQIRVDHIVSTNSSIELVLGKTGKQVSIYGNVLMPDLNRTNSGDPNMIIELGEIYKKSGSLKKWKHAISNITEPSIDPHKLYNVKPRQFIYNDWYLPSNDCRYNKIIPGFIVDELIDDYPVAVNYDKNGNPQNWSPSYLIPPMLSLIQEQHTQNVTMQSQIESLQTNSLSLHGQILSLQGENTILKQRLNRLEELLNA